jgi:hypothetical protein
MREERQKMSQFELSVSPNYVSDWGITEAIRELFQNAIDQESISQDNKMFFEYKEETQEILIGNKESILTPKSLLLGTSTKSDNDDTIGKFGEGYKIATLVLLRNNKEITFYNYGAKEVWLPRFVKSRRYGGVNILTFDVKKNYFWQSVPDNNLTIVVGGITKEEYLQIKNTNLHLQELQDSDIINTQYGKILLNEKYKGRFFVNGLYVANKNNFQYGYDVVPKYMNLDRDRKLLETYELCNITSQMWGKSNQYDIIYTMFEKNSVDISSLYAWNMNSAIMKNEILKKFKKEHGEHAVPVVSTNQMQGLKSSYKPIIVSHTYQNVLMSSEEYNMPKKKTSSKELLIMWFSKNESLLEEYLPQTEIEDLLNIISDMS